jgi:UDP-3-O-acyl-N-acetylglucosamine deacetylase
VAASADRTPGGELTVTPWGRDAAAARPYPIHVGDPGAQAKGLIKGASSANAIVLDERGLANGGQLRWPDEFGVTRRLTSRDLAFTGCAGTRAHHRDASSHGGNIKIAGAPSRARRAA